MIRISPAIVSDFAVQDKETNAIPFRIDAGAPTNAMKLSTDGNLGLGSGPPMAELRVVTSAHPTLKLEEMPTTSCPRSPNITP